MDQSFSFDHLIHWVDDIDDAMAAYNEIGLSARQALTMPGFRNAAWGVDDERYVELAAVDDWQAVQTSKFARAFEILRPAVDVLAGPGLLTFSVNVADARALAARLRESGHEVDEVEVYLDEAKVGFVEVFVRDLPLHYPFFITYDPPREEIARMRVDSRAEQGITFDGQPDLAALLLHSPDPEAEAQRLADLLECDVTGSTVLLPGAEVRFEPGAPAGLFGIAVHGLAADAGDLNVLGMTVRPEQ